MYKKKIIKNLLKKNFFLIFFIIIIFIVFLQKTNFSINFYSLITKTHVERFIKAQNKNIYSGFCEKQAHGYIASIANKFAHLFSEKKIPQIINFDKIRRIPSWIFLHTDFKIDNQYIILLNSNLNKDFDFSKFKILNNFQNKCFFLERND